MGESELRDDSDQDEESDVDWKVGGKSGEVKGGGEDNWPVEDWESGVRTGDSDSSQGPSRQRLDCCVGEPRGVDCQVEDGELVDCWEISVKYYIIK